MLNLPSVNYFYLYITHTPKNMEISAGIGHCTNKILCCFPVSALLLVNPPLISKNSEIREVVVFSISSSGGALLAFTSPT